MVPVFCFDPRLSGTTTLGNPKTGSFKSKFLLESVDALRAALQGIGSNLLTTYSGPEHTLAGASPVTTSSTLRCACTANNMSC